MRTALARAFFSISWRGPTRSAWISAKSIACNGRDATWAGLQTILSLSAQLLQASAPPAFRSKATGKLRARALCDCQNNLRFGDADEARSLWSRLVAVADTNRAGGSIDLASL